MMTKIKNIKATGYALSDSDRAIIEEVSRSTGLLNLSAALRLIINQWAEQNGGRLTAKGRAALLEAQEQDK